MSFSSIDCFLTGLLLQSLNTTTTQDSPSLSLLNNSLKLLSSLLMHRFRPHPPLARAPGDGLTSDPAHVALANALQVLMDGGTEEAAERENRVSIIFFFQNTDCDQITDP